MWRRRREALPGRQAEDSARRLRRPNLLPHYLTAARRGSLHHMAADRWSMEELRGELVRFEATLRAAELRESSVRTYVDRSARFLDWLDGKYQPRGPNAT